MYRARDDRLCRIVALKILSDGLAADPSFRGRFADESRIAAGLDHPNVVPIYEAGESDGRLFIAMRLVDGVDRGTLIARDGPLDPGRTIDLLRGIAGAIRPQPYPRATNKVPASDCRPDRPMPTEMPWTRIPSDERTRPLRSGHRRRAT